MPPAEQIEIRRLTAEDAHAYYGLRLEALEHEPLAFNESSEEHRAITIDSIAEKLGSGESSDSFVLGAFTEDQFIGMVGFARFPGVKKQHRAVVWGVYVKPEWRRKGIARVLLSEVIERAKAIPGIDQVVLSVATEYAPARKLYESLGFQGYGCDPRTLKVNDRYVDEDLMILQFAG